MEAPTHAVRHLPNGTHAVYQAGADDPKSAAVAVVGKPQVEASLLRRAWAAWERAYPGLSWIDAVGATLEGWRVLAEEERSTEERRKEERALAEAAPFLPLARGLLEVGGWCERVCADEADAKVLVQGVKRAASLLGCTLRSTTEPRCCAHQRPACGEPECRAPGTGNMAVAVQLYLFPRRAGFPAVLPVKG